MATLGFPRVDVLHGQLARSPEGFRGSKEGSGLEISKGWWGVVWQHGLGLIFRRKNVKVFISDEPAGCRSSLQDPPPEGWIPVLQSVSGWFGGMVSGPGLGWRLRWSVV